ncbi:unnamed protein product [Pedinophyceae sp. YPF-701]|nr:unnamed protein product [Pedinophyceae sp. YPF-701]
MLEQGSEGGPGAAVSASEAYTPPVPHPALRHFADLTRGFPLPTCPRHSSQTARAGFCPARASPRPLRAARAPPRPAAPPRAPPTAAPRRPRPAALVARSATKQAGTLSQEGQVLAQLERIIDPDFGQNIVECGFIKNLDIAGATVSFDIELTTPACPIKDKFERDAHDFVAELPWVDEVKVTMTAQKTDPMMAGNGRPGGLAKVKHVIAVSSCKGGVGKSTTSVNLAFTLAQMGAKVGIFDADVFGPSLPQMISPEVAVLKADEYTGKIHPVEYMGVKAVSFGYTGSGAAVMRGPMVAGLVQELLVAPEWGELDYLILDFPPGTGDVQLTICQTLAITAAVIVTTPQKLAFIDVAKGIRMFAKLRVPCVACVENMSYFVAEDTGNTYYPFGKGSGERIQQEFGLPNLVRMPIIPDLSVAGDTGVPLVVSKPAGETAHRYGDLGAAVVREVAKLEAAPKQPVRYDKALNALVVRLPGEEEFLLDPPTVRRNDKSAVSVDEWTGQRLIQDEDIPDDLTPEEEFGINPLGNYAVQINWKDGFNQVATFEQLLEMPRLELDEDEARERMMAAAVVPDLSDEWET